MSTIDQVLTQTLTAQDVPIAAIDTNGVTVLADFTTSAEFIQSENRIVVNKNLSMNLRASVARAIWVKSGSPANAVQVSPQNILGSIGAIAGHMARFDLITIFAHTNIDPSVTFRRADFVTAEVYETIPQAVRTAFEKAADAIVHVLRSDENLAAEHLHSGRFATLCLIANAINREGTGGHNWYTDTTSKSATVGGKALAVAGADVEEFGSFMSMFGHDLWHLFPDNLLYKMAAVITENSACETNAAIQYRGSEWAVSTPVASLFKVEDAAKDRYPPSQLGRSAAILCSRVFRFFVVDIMSRVPGEATLCDQIIAVLDDYNAIVSKPTFTRADAQKVKKNMGKIFAFAYGYASAFPADFERFEKNKSLGAWAAQEDGELAVGSSVGKWAKGKDKDDTMMASVAKAALESLLRAQTANNAEVGMVAAADEEEEEDH